LFFFNFFSETQIKILQNNHNKILLTILIIKSIISITLLIFNNKRHQKINDENLKFYEKKTIQNNCLYIFIAMDIFFIAFIFFEKFILKYL